MITYTVNGYFFCECEEGSLFNIILEEMIKQQRESNTKEALKAINHGTPVKITEKQHKDILYDLRKSE